MEIIVPKYNWLKMRGYVKVDLFHGEDIDKKEPLFHDEGDNTIANELLTQIVDHVDQSISGAFAYTLNLGAQGSHTSSHGSWSGSNHDQDGKMGMLVDADASVPASASTHAFFLSESDSTTIVSTYTRRWIAEGTWNGTGNDGDGNTGSITDCYLGANWDQPANTGLPDIGGNGAEVQPYAQPFAEFTVSSFTMQPADVVKITWDIAVDV